MQTKILIRAILLTVILSSFEVQAAPGSFNAGDLDAGQQWVISTSGYAASYVKRAPAGMIVKFVCDLEPTVNSANALKAKLTSAGNFGMTQQQYLFNGINGPYVWTLNNLGNDSGNVIVQLMQGDGEGRAYIKCKTVS